MADNLIPRPRPISRQYILDTIGDTTRGVGQWRNPAVLPDVTGSWPKPQDDRARNRHKMLGLEEGGPYAKKGPY